MASKDFTDDFLKILRSGFNTEDELDEALASAKQKYKDELIAKKEAEAKAARKETLLLTLKNKIYDDYISYLNVAYPDYEQTEDTKKRFFKELDYTDYSVGAKKVSIGGKNIPVNDFESVINAMFEEVMNPTP